MRAQRGHLASVPFRFPSAGVSALCIEFRGGLRCSACERTNLGALAEEVFVIESKGYWRHYSNYEFYILCAVCRISIAWLVEKKNEIG